MSNKSPLRYPGGKTRACKILDEIISSRVNIEDYDVLVSPFFGGGSFEFHIQNMYGLHLLVNDKFKPLFIFWRTLKNNKTDLVQYVRSLHPASKDDFVQYRSEIMDLCKKCNTKSPIEKIVQVAAYYFVINRCSFSGATLSGGFSQQAAANRFNANSIKNLEKINLSKLVVHNNDFTKFITDVFAKLKNKKRTLMFLDPPYYLGSGSKLYGKNGDMHENFNHEALAELLSQYSNWIMTYNNCEYIRDLYADYEIVDAAWSYGMNASKKSSEIVIINLPGIHEI